MKQILIILFFLNFGDCLSQDNIIITQRYCSEISCKKSQKLQHTFDSQANILEEVWFGRHHNPDTTAIGFSRKFKYNNSKVMEVLINQGSKYDESSVSYLYFKNRINAITYKKYDDVQTTKYFYNTKGKIKSKITARGSETLTVVSYSYKNNELSQMFSYQNDIENERTIYTKSKDTIIKTLIRHDSVHIKKPWIYVTKQKFDKGKIIYFSNFVEEDESKEDSFVTYDLLGNITKLEVHSVEQNSHKKVTYNFIYVNGIIRKVLVSEVKNDALEPDRFIIYDVQSNVEIKSKFKEKINQYFTNWIMKSPE